MFDVVVIGAGSAGFSAVEAARHAGARVCLIEEDRLGGECPNWGCIPSKAMLRSAKLYREVLEAERFGIKARRVTFHFEKITDYRRSIVDRITGGGARGDRYVQMAKKMGVKVFFGTARFSGSHLVEVTDTRGALVRVQGRAFVVATGTIPFIPPVDGLDRVPYWTFKDVMKNRKQPRSLLILGGGPVGCEIACFYATFGTRVTLIQGASAILNREDPEISARARQALETQGVRVLLNTQVSAVKRRR